jgi:hypothetical protein
MSTSRCGDLCGDLCYVTLVQTGPFCPTGPFGRGRCGLTGCLIAVVYGLGCRQVASRFLGPARNPLFSDFQPCFQLKFRFNLAFDFGPRIVHAVAGQLCVVGRSLLRSRNILRQLAGPTVFEIDEAIGVQIPKTLIDDTYDCAARCACWRTTRRSSSRMCCPRTATSSRPALMTGTWTRPTGVVKSAGTWDGTSKSPRTTAGRTWRWCGPDGDGRCPRLCRGGAPWCIGS